jgi:molybdopterin synthase catalytic subunit
MEKKAKNIFIPGAIKPEFISDSIARHASKKDIGAHSIFLGQVRADQTDKGIVESIEYTSYEEMALEKMAQIREEIFSKFDLTCLHVYHSLGVVAAGEICLFVFTSSAHRKNAIAGCEELVERIKAELPVWGREIIADGGHQWKVNQ